MLQYQKSQKLSSKWLSLLLKRRLAATTKRHYNTFGHKRSHKNFATKSKSETCLQFSFVYKQKNITSNTVLEV